MEYQADSPLLKHESAKCVDKFLIMHRMYECTLAADYGFIILFEIMNLKDFQQLEA
jgi:hypothetical protein